AYLTTEFRIRTGRELKRMRAQYDDVLRELGFARAEARRIYDALAGFRMPVEERRRLEEAANEVKGLRGLIDKLGGAREPVSPAEVEIPAEPAPAAPVRVTAAGPRDDGAILDIVREGLEMDRVDLYLQPVVSLP